LAYPVRASFEDRSVRVPGDQYVRSDLRGIRKETTGSGNIRFTGERTANGHCDRFWALALALHAGKGTGRTFEYEMGATESRGVRAGWGSRGGLI
jgi:phage FluMu gp28-like protein